MRLLFDLPLILSVLGQNPPPPPPGFDLPAARAERLEFMKKALEVFDVRTADSPQTRYRLRPDPIIRFTNPVGGARDGGLYLWLDDGGRPGVVAKIVRNREGNWLQALSSVSTTPLVGTARTGPDWTPSRGGIELRPVPDAPKPAATTEQRQVQMRALARGFSAEDDFRQQGFSALRLLPRPLAAYGKSGPDLIEGAVFAFVLATDPEALLVLEVRSGAGGPEWQFAFAPMTDFAVKGSWKGREVWNLPRRFQAARQVDASYYVRRLAPPE